MVYGAYNTCVAICRTLLCKVMEIVIHTSRGHYILKKGRSWVEV